MTQRHMNWPLGARVQDRRSNFVGTVFKHWDERPYVCSVRFSETDVCEVTFNNLVLLDVERRGERPWYRNIDALRKARQL